MSTRLFQRIVVPIGSRDDAAKTAAALAAHLEEGESTVIVVHVIEKAGGAPDKASVEQRERVARDIFDTVRDAFETVDVSLDTRILYGRDIAATVIEAAHERDASAIVFTPRGGSRWQKLLSGDVTHTLVETSDVPILVLPDREEAAT